MDFGRNKGLRHQNGPWLYRTTDPLMTLSGCMDHKPPVASSGYTEAAKPEDITEASGSAHIGLRFNGGNLSQLHGPTTLTWPLVA